MKTLRKLLLIVASALMGFGHTLQAKENKPHQHPGETLVVKPQLRTGQLKNGLTYYIKPIKNSDELQVKLYIHAGSFHQESDQFSVAHFMEHIATKAGKNISSKMRYDSDLFKAAGIKPRDMLASTGATYTEFSFALSPNEKAVDAAFLYYSDILWNLEFKQVYIDSERSPFLGEFELKGGATSRSFMESYLNNKITGCSGTPPDNYTDYIWQLKREPLLRFYRQWYRPEYASLVIVGQVENIENLEKKIKAQFSKSSNTKKTEAPKDCVQRYHDSAPKWVKQKMKTLLQETKGGESYWQLYMRNDSKIEVTSLKDMQDQWLRKVMVRSLNNQLRQLTQKYNTHYFATTMYSESLGTLQIKIGVTHGKEEKKAIQETIGVLKTLKRKGISPETFEQLKMDMIKTLKNKNDRSIAYWANEIKNHAVEGQFLLENKKAAQLKFIENLSLPQFNKALQHYLKEMPEDIGVVASEAHPAFSYTESTIRAWINQAKEIISHEKEATTPLLSQQEIKQLLPSSYRKLDSGIPNASEYVLENGVRLMLKPYEPAPSVFGDEDKVRIHGFSLKGAKCYPEEDYYSALNAPKIVLNSGAGGKNKFALAQYLKTKDYKGTIYPYIRPYETGVYLNTPIGELETALQLIYLYFKEPNQNQEAYKDWKVSASYKYLLQINQGDFINKIRQTLKDPYLLPDGMQAVKGIEQTDLKRAYKIYQDLFGNAGDFTFLFSGNFQEKEVLKLCRKYLGNLPISRSTVACSQKPRIPTHNPLIKRYHQFQANENSQNTKVKLVYLSPLDKGHLGWKDKVKLHVFYKLLEYTLMKKLRMSSEKGGPYTVGVGNSYLDNAPRFKEIAIDFGGRPEDIERLMKETKRVIKHIKNADITDNMFQTSLKSQYPEKDKFTNSELQKNMYEYARHGKDWINIEKKRKYLSSLSLEKVLHFSEGILQNPPYEFKLLPHNFEQ